MFQVLGLDYWLSVLDVFFSLVSWKMILRLSYMNYNKFIYFNKLFIYNIFKLFFREIFDNIALDLALCDVISLDFNSLIVSHVIQPTLPIALQTSELVIFVTELSVFLLVIPKEPTPTNNPTGLTKSSVNKLSDKLTVSFDVGDKSPYPPIDICD